MQQTRKTFSTFLAATLFGLVYHFFYYFLLCIISARDIDRCGARRRDKQQQTCRAGRHTKEFHCETKL